jgi:outer membrane protein assembly factor BamB
LVSSALLFSALALALGASSLAACGNDDKPPPRPGNCPVQAPNCGSGGAAGGGGGSTEDVTLTCLALLGTAGYDRVDGLAVDSEGNIYVAGFFQGSLAIGSETFDSGNQYDEFVAKLDPACQPLWAFQVGQPTSSVTGSTHLRLAVGPDDKLVIAGDLVGESAVVSSDGASISRNGMAPDLFVVKLEADGALAWDQPVQFAQTVTVPEVSAIAFGANGDIHLVGSLDANAATPGPLFVETMLDESIFVVKIAAADGALIWEQMFQQQGSLYIQGADLAVDGDGNVAVAGNFNGSLTVGSDVFETTGSESEDDVVVFKLDAEGEPLWARHFAGDNEFQRAYSVTVDGEGSVYVGGALTGVMDVGLPDPLEAYATNDYDAFVVKLTADGDSEWAVAPSEADQQECFSLEMDSLGRVVMGGRFRGAFNLALALQAEDLDGFVVTLTPGGEPVWARRVGGMSKDEVWAVAGSPTPAGAVVFGGKSTSDLHDGVEPLMNHGQEDFMVGVYVLPEE